MELALALVGVREGELESCCTLNFSLLPRKTAQDSRTASLALSSRVWGAGCSSRGQLRISRRVSISKGTQKQLRLIYCLPASLYWPLLKRAGNVSFLIAAESSCSIPRRRFQQFLEDSPGGGVLLCCCQALASQLFQEQEAYHVPRGWFL